jgi:hypothetical protein
LAVGSWSVQRLRLAVTAEMPAVSSNMHYEGAKRKTVCLDMQQVRAVMPAWDAICMAWDDGCSTSAWRGVWGGLGDSV